VRGHPGRPESALERHGVEGGVYGFIPARRHPDD